MIRKFFIVILFMFSFAVFADEKDEDKKEQIFTASGDKTVVAATHNCRNDVSENKTHHHRHRYWWYSHEKDPGDFSLTLGMQWWFPVGSFNDNWKDGLGFNMHFDYWVYDYLTLGFAFNDIGLNPNSDKLGVDTTDWHANIYSWSFSPKIYLLHDKIFINPSLGGYLIRRNVPTFSALSAALQSELKDENTFGGGIETGVLFWHFIVFGVGYNYMYDEGQTMFIDFSFQI